MYFRLVEFLDEGASTSRILMAGLPIVKVKFRIKEDLLMNSTKAHAISQPEAEAI